MLFDPGGLLCQGPKDNLGQGDKGHCHSGQPGLLLCLSGIKYGEGINWRWRMGCPYCLTMTTKRTVSCWPCLCIWSPSCTSKTWDTPTNSSSSLVSFGTSRILRTWLRMFFKTFIDFYYINYYKWSIRRRFTCLRSWIWLGISGWWK